MKNRKKINLILIIFGVLLISVFAIRQLVVHNSKCPTDLNGDGITDNQDVLILNESYNIECSKTFFRKCPTDFNNDGITDAADLSILISMHGKTCE